MRADALLLEGLLREYKEAPSTNLTRDAKIEQLTAEVAALKLEVQTLKKQKLDGNAMCLYNVPISYCRCENGRSKLDNRGKMGYSTSVEWM